MWSRLLLAVLRFPAAAVARVTALPLLGTMVFIGYVSVILGAGLSRLSGYVSTGLSRWSACFTSPPQAAVVSLREFKPSKEIRTMEATTLAIEYLRRTDKKMSPSEYLLELKRLESEFSQLLLVEDLEQKLKDDTIKRWEALSS